MSEVREEYTRETYPSFGKKYNGEKAIISLTSWRARINTVSKTLFSLLKQCPGFHIVLVLSEEEFPKMMNELPENLKLFTDNKLIEVLWVYKNYKSFKKVLFTMNKYRDVPVISADDDCIYTCNYAQELYDKWRKNKLCSIRYTPRKLQITQGPCNLYKLPSEIIIAMINDISPSLLKESQDDAYLSKQLVKYKIKIISAKTTTNLPFVFHDTVKPLTKGQEKSPFYRNCFRGMK